jgi:hypothetical protein
MSGDPKQSSSESHSGTQTPSLQTPVGHSAVVVHGLSVVVVVEVGADVVGVLVVVVVVMPGMQWWSSQMNPPVGES